MLKRLKNNKSGMTLLEILIAIFILSVGILSILLFISSAMILSTGAWEMTVATTHAESILEEMQTKKTLGEITLADWNDWAQKQEFSTLPKESFIVTFPSGGKNPLDVQVLVNWVQNERWQNIVLRTKITR
ncbi:MAG: hypothetical protein A3D10_06665 [Omnitrophica WOR_2 bacterium RIFCSPHIGHO2_02_FULL_48_11]|nr:MAG: hypothetical protein A3D10_06665 [Omnitrophica WOR_2 bacterium RIFCSPHIGHO2_02_FULL_48_11]